MTAFELPALTCSFGNSSFCHCERRRLPRRSYGEGGRNLLLLLIYVKLCGHDETDTAAHNRRIPRNTTRRKPVAVVASFFSSARNISLLKRARSRHQSGNRADVRRQRASRNSQLLRRRPESRRVLLENRHRKITTMLPDRPPPKRRPALSPQGPSPGPRPRIRPLLSRTS